MGLLDRYRQLAYHRCWPSEGQCIPEQLDFIHALLRTHPDIRQVIEVGFNGGLSAAAFLSGRGDIQVVSFDLGAWSCVLPAKQLIDEVFPGRHRLILGNSLETLPAFLEDAANQHAYDLVFVDGGHEAPVPASDLRAARQLLRPTGWVLLDDYCSQHGSRGVMAAWDAAIAAREFVQVGSAYAVDDRGWVCGRPL